MKNLRNVTKCAFLCLVAVFCIVASFARPEAEEVAPEAKTKKQLTFAVVPQQSASRMAREWGPLIGALSDETDLSIRFVTTKDIPTFEACLNNGVFDIAYMNPYHYVVFSDNGDYRAIAHQEGKKLKGLIVVQADSNLSDITGLNSSVVAFPSPGAFGASVLPRAELGRQGIEVDARYVRSHDSVYRAVAGGFAVAGGGVTRTLAAAPKDLREQLRVIYTTDGYTPHAIAVHDDLSKEVTQQLQNALTTLDEVVPETTRALGISAFVAADDSKWDDVRSLHLTPEQTGLDQLDEVVCPFD